MTFLNSALLAALSLGLIPILIHLLNRQKFKEVDFPTLRFLQEMQRQKMRRVRVRQWLLLLLRTLAILALVLAMARPVLRSEAGFIGSGEARASVVLVLDRSVSMRTESPGGTRFRELQVRAQDLIQSLGSNDEIQIIWADAVPQRFPDSPTQHKPLLREAVEAAQAQETGGSLTDAVAEARLVLGQSQNLLKEVYVLSDFSESTWPQKLPDTPLLPEDVRLYVVPLGGAEFQNVGLVNAEITSRLIAPGRAIELSFTAVNSGKDQAQDRIVSAYLDGKRVAQTRVSLRPGESRTEQLRFVPENIGDATGYVRLEDTDAFADDDIRRFVLRVPARLNVAVTGADGTARRLAALALDPSGSPDSYVHAVQLGAQEFEAADWLDFDAVFIVDAPAFSAGFDERLRGYLQTGRGVFVTGGPNFDLRAHSIWMQALGLPAPTGVEDAGEAAGWRWNKVDLDHPLFEGVFEERPSDISPEFSRVFSLAKERSTAANIIEGAGGKAYLCEVTQGRGRMLFLASSPDPDWSTLFRSGVFPPLMTGSAAYLAGSGNAGLDLAQTVGLGADLLLRKTEQLQYELVSNEAPLKLTATPVSGGQMLRVPPLFVTGDYRLTQGERNVLPLVVNIPARESAIDVRLEDANLESLGGNLQRLDPGENMLTVIREGRYGRELWKLFLMLALGLLIAEMLIARTPKQEVVPA
ncbi:MAG: BatA domain-containing protein [Calditrichaeota bacterium]|nr:BatA domain-containing protein [Calditrichota bacterium]